MTNKSTSKGMETKKKILVSALEVFGESGFRDAKVETIAKKAGVGKGTIYHHFTTKEAILSEMVLFFMDEYFRHMKLIFDKDEPLRVKLIEWLHFNIKCSVSHDNFVEIFKGDNISVSASYQKLIIDGKVEMISLLKRTIGLAVDKGELSPVRDYNLAVSMMIGTVTQYYFCRSHNKGETKEIIDYNNIDVEIICDDIYKMLEVI